MRQSSGQNMHGQWLRDPVYASVTVTISVSAYYIRDYQRICFVARISEIAPRVY